MSSCLRASLFVASLFVAGLVALTVGPSAVADDVIRPSAKQIEFFENKIRPLLANHCYDCHSEEEQEADLRLDTREGMLNGGKAGPSVVAGKPKSSLIVTAVSYRDGDLQMPPEKKLTDQQIADLTRWVEMGAPHPDSGKVDVSAVRSGIDFDEARRHWSFQPLAEPAIPGSPNAQHQPGGAPSPIDAFIEATLQEHDLRSLGRADARTLIRRATFDLLGLPPTVAEIKEFEIESRRDPKLAFQRLVDRLLESPHYGERWGRHWLDVARYADSNGRDENAAHANAWRYRDYVIESFNKDKPYDQFLIEQLAGDLLDSGDDLGSKHQRLIATGYLMLGPKVLAEVDEQKMEMDIVDEQIDTIGRGLMGLTLGCARCHDHKFDPLEHSDYYALVGIFKSTKTMESFKKVAKWNEVSIATPEDIIRRERYELLVSEKGEEIEERISRARSDLAPPTGESIPTEIEKRFPEATRAAIKRLREELKNLKESTPEMPTAMAAADGTVLDAAIHIRGSHLTLGGVVPRRFPRVFAGDDPASLPTDRSGRLEFARWLTSKDHPLTARVIVNRLWRWHFGKGLVATVDNFGINGESPSHPELLNWMAVQLIKNGWSIKDLHRLIMLSETYQRSSRVGKKWETADADPNNRYYWRFAPRRLEAEAIRDALLAVSGTLDRTLGGQLMTTPNRELVFNHTSQDQTSYDTRRRSIYLPVIRNRLYDMFQLFDYSDASVINGNRNTSTVAPQALFLFNSQFMSDAAKAMSERLLAAESTREQRVETLFWEAYGRPPTIAETERITLFLSACYEVDTETGTSNAWQSVCQSVFSSSEFIYLP